MALIDVDKSNVHVAHLLNHMPEGKWDVYQIGKSPTEVLLVHHDVRDRFGYKILDTLLRETVNGADVLMDTLFALGWKTDYKVQPSLDLSMEQWIEDNHLYLSSCKLIRLQYIDSVTLSYTNGYVLKC